MVNAVKVFTLRLCISAYYIHFKRVKVKIFTAFTIVSKTTVNIGTTSYEILGHDILISSTGVVNVMLLLNTTDVFSTPQDISCTISGDV